MIFISLSCAPLRFRYSHLPEISKPLEFLESIIHDRSSFSDITIQCRITISSHSGTSRSKNIIQAKEPDSLRLVTLGFLGHPVIIAHASNSLLTVSLLTENRHFSGPSDPDNLVKIFGVPLSVHEIVNILQGRISLEIREAHCSQERSLYRCNLDTDCGSSTLWIDPDRAVIRRFSGKLFCSKSYEISFDRFMSFGDKLIPFRISITCPSDRLSITIEYASFSTEPIDTHSFSYSPPPSEVLSLDMLPRLW